MVRNFPHFVRVRLSPHSIINLEVWEIMLLEVVVVQTLPMNVVNQLEKPHLFYVYYLISLVPCYLGDKVQITETSDNTDILENARGCYNLMKKKFLPLLQKWYEKLIKSKHKNSGNMIAFWTILLRKIFYFSETFSVLCPPPVASSNFQI